MRQILVCLALSACVGDIPGGQSGEAVPPPASNPIPCGLERPCDGTSATSIDPASLVVPVGARRLTAGEYANTIEVLLGERPPQPELDWLPLVSPSPFDNDVAKLGPDDQLVEALDAIAERAAMRALGNPARRDRLIPCNAKGPDDAACLRAFVESFGRLAFRRPLDDDEKTFFTGSASQGPLSLAIKNNDFNAGVEIVIRSMLQDPVFLYRIEIGTPVKGQTGLFALDGHEIATRMAYLLWQRPPEAYQGLKQAADTPGALEDPVQRRAIAEAMLGDPLGAAQLQRFHNLWLAPATPEFTDADARTKQAKTSASVAEFNQQLGRVIKDKRPWMDLFRSDRTWITKPLADHYGMRWPPGAGNNSTWVLYEGSGRKGILATAGMLAAGFKMNEHGSSVGRGLALFSKLMCQDLKPPSAQMLAELAKMGGVTPPDHSACKIEQSRFRLDSPGCAGCHRQFEVLGVGLEPYDGSGKLRTAYEWTWTEKQPVAGAKCTQDANEYLCAKTCPVSTEGAGFNNVAELADRLLAREKADQASALERCAATQLFRFAAGRREDPATDDALLRVLGGRLLGERNGLADLLLDYVSSESFRQTRRFE